MTHSRSLEFWNSLSGAQNGDPIAIAERAVQLEAEGWDGAVMLDTQCLSVDPYVTLALCAQRTRTLRLATGVTNPLTRHPAVTAAAAATLQLVSGGRAVLGIGRGDSALAYLGCAPQPIGDFERSLRMIQAYLRGDAVPLEDAAAAVQGGRAGFEQTALASGPPASVLKWLAPDHVKVPLEVAATGAKAIAIAAAVADQVLLVMGADPDRLRWGLQTAHEAAERSGRDPAMLRIGAMMVIRTHDDLAVARRLALGGVSATSRFLFINKTFAAPVSAADKDSVRRVAQAYDMKAHGMGGAQAEALDDAFVDRFAIVGSPQRCLERIDEIAELGFHKLVLTSGGFSQDPAGRDSHQRAALEVLPALRARYAA